MSRHVAGYAAALLALVLLDALWLGLISREFYKARLGQLLLEQPVWSIAILFYLIHAVGMMVFPVPMALNGGTWMTAAIYGALFGFFAYAAYDITNLATLRGWPLAVSLVDLAWGTFATAVASTAGYIGARAVS